MNTAMHILLSQYANLGTEVQLRFKQDVNVQQGAGVVGPGKLEVVTLTDPSGDQVAGLFTFMMPVFVGQQGKQPQQMIMPITFSAADVLWVSTGPLMNNEPAIITPGSGRGRGGLHIPGA